MFTTTETTARPTRSMPDFRVPPRELVDVGHSRLAYRRVGRGPDLLLVHGWPLTMATYRRLLPTLAEQFTCHLVDLPGAGFTEISERTPISMHDHCDTLERAIEVIGLDRYALLAHDSGGFFARAVAARHGDRVTGIVLGNTETPGHHSPLLQAMALAVRSSAGRRALLTMMRSRKVRRSRVGFGGCFDDLDLLDGDFHDLFVAPLLDDPDYAARQMRLLTNFDMSSIDGLPDIHRRITAPVQLIWGKDDAWFPIAGARAMQSHFSGGCDLELLPGKLLVHEEHPEAFADLTIRFLKRAARAAA